ncbi:MAG: YaiO family outer membrane beta-barrel protein [Gammaproteobacteria bacterium]|nr:YaiO family outer membrane beta-barrel protein [Gammaproteobacteria bacterium]
MAALYLAIQAVSLAYAADTQNMSGSANPSGYVSLDYMHAELSGGYSDWSDRTLHLNLQLRSDDQVSVEISKQTHFDDQGTFYGLGFNHTFSRNWYGALNLGSSKGGIFLPQFRADAFLSRKWMDDKRLITTLGLGYYDAKDDHVDHSRLISATYYFPVQLIIEVGARLNNSDPGDVSSSRGYAVLTYGENKRQYLTLRYESGKEAYQLIGSNAVISDFVSHESIVSWRQWLLSNYGWNISANHYVNPNYNRTGIQAGLFYEF